MKRNITLAALTALLMDIKGAKFTTIVTETEPDMRKTDNPFYGRVTKRSTVNVTLNASYRNGVTKALKKAGFSKTTAENVTINKPTWGERMGSSPLIMHKGHLYLHAKLNAKPSKISYTYEGAEMNAKEVKNMNTFLSAKAHQAVPVVSIRLENIKELKLDKQHFIVE